MSNPKLPPAKNEIAVMEPFTGLGLDSVVVVRNRSQAQSACDELFDACTVGFDTESKPTFYKGQNSDGPHVLQFATLKRAFIFLTHADDCHPAIIDLLVSPRLSKIGFDLRGDLRHITRRFGVVPAGILDLGTEFRKLGFRHTIGATSAVAMLFRRRLHKPKSVTTSNWSARELTERQLLYAANDAYAAIQVFHALQQGQNPEIC